MKYRPSYPAAAIDIILEGLAPPTELVAVDIGAGTGISSRLLAECGVSVIAIEPNAAMRERQGLGVTEARGGTETLGQTDISPLLQMPIPNP